MNSPLNLFPHESPAAWDDDLIGAIKPHIISAGLTLIRPDAPYVVCPGREFHTKPNKETDCRIWHNYGHPRISCFHQSCAGVVAEVNFLLSGSSDPYRRWYPRVYTALHCGFDATNILRKNRWDAQDIQADSPTKLDDAPHEHWLRMMTLFQPDDVIWIGRDVYDAGKVDHAWRFRTAGYWQQQSFCPGPFICPNSFVPDSYKRTAANIQHLRYLVVESDVLSHDETGAVFRFLQSDPINLTLRAVVDTAGKSLHGWFEYPNTKTLECLRLLIPSLHCDGQLMKPNQPCRLPGAKRDSNHQRLIYFR